MTKTQEAMHKLELQVAALQSLVGILSAEREPRPGTLAIEVALLKQRLDQLTKTRELWGQRGWATLTVGLSAGAVARRGRHRRVDDGLPESRKVTPLAAILDPGSSRRSRPRPAMTPCCLALALLVPPPLAPGRPAPPLDLVATLRGEAVAGLPQGKLCVVEFSGTLCDPCVRCIPLLNAMQAEHKDALFVSVFVQKTRRRSATTSPASAKTSASASPSAARPRGRGGWTRPA